MKILKQKSIIAALFVCLFIGNITAQDLPFSDYLKFSRHLDNIDTLQFKGKYQKALEKMKRMGIVPTGLGKVHYLNMADSYYHIGQMDSASHYYRKAIDNWCYRMAFEYRAKEEATNTPNCTFYRDLLSTYDTLISTKCDDNYQRNSRIVDSMYTSDQSIRKTLHEAILNNDSTQREEIIAKMKVIDTRNYNQYDSLAKIYGWVGKDMHINKNYNIDIILYHQNKGIYYSNIDRGYALAYKNKIDWFNVYNLQSYALARVNSFHIDEIDFVDYYPLHTLNTDDEKFLFFCYCLYDSVITSNFLGMENKVQVFAKVPSNSEWSQRKVYKSLKKVRRKVIHLGLEKDRIILDKEKYMVEDESGTKCIIGTKRI